VKTQREYRSGERGYVAGELAIGISNPVADQALPAAGGGRGLRGIRERTALLGGRTQAGRHGQDWIVSVEIPL